MHTDRPPGAALSACIRVDRRPYLLLPELGGRVVSGQRQAAARIRIRTADDKACPTAPPFLSSPWARSLLPALRYLQSNPRCTNRLTLSPGHLAGAAPGPLPILTWPPTPALTYWLEIEYTCHLLDAGPPGARLVFADRLLLQEVAVLVECPRSTAAANVAELADPAFALEQVGVA